MEANNEMDVLIAAALRGDATPEELERLWLWRRASPTNEAAFRDMARLWQVLGRAATEASASPAPSATVLVERAGVRPLPVFGAAGSTRSIRWRVEAVAVAATVILGIGLAAAWLARPNDPSLGVKEFATGSGETATVSLVDGTVVRLGPQSRLQLNRGSAGRTVSFQGRAFFAVAHDPSKPFEIETAAGSVRVLGTRFDLAVDQEDLRVSVVEGVVKLEARGQETLVRRGEVGRVLRGVAVPATRTAAGPSTSWLGTFFAFQSTPLRDAVAEITQRRGVRVIIADSSLADRSVTGYFDEADAAVMMRVICAAVVAQCPIRGGVIVMERP